MQWVSVMMPGKESVLPLLDFVKALEMMKVAVEIHDEGHGWN